MKNALWRMLYEKRNIQMTIQNNKSNRVRTIDAFSLKPVLNIDYYIFACSFVLILLL